MKTISRVLVLLAAVALLAACDNGTEESGDADNAATGDQTYYWISHGSSADPFWVAAVQGAETAGEDLGVTVNTSFHGGDIAAQLEAFQAAVAAGADGIAVSSPEAGTMADAVSSARDAGINVVFFNTDDPDTGRNAYVGADLYLAGQSWAQYLVDNDLVSEGDSVWLPVEVPGATYQVDETRGIASVFDPLGIEYEVFDTGYEPAESLSNMTDYLTANVDNIDAIIGLGDVVMGNVQTILDSAGIEAGEIPAVGWGNTEATAVAVQEGYVNAATWQFPDAQGYDPIIMLHKMTQGLATGYDVVTMILYEQDEADRFIELAPDEE